MGRQRAPSCRQNEALQEKRSEKSVFRGRCALTPRFAATVLSIITIICIFLFFFLSMEAPRPELCAPHPLSAPPLPFPLISMQTRSSEASLPALARPSSAHPGPNPRYPPGSSRSQPARQPKGGENPFYYPDGMRALLGPFPKRKAQPKRGSAEGSAPQLSSRCGGGSGRSGSGCVQCRGEGKKKLRKKKKKNSSPLGPIPSPPAAPSSSTWLAQVFHVNDSNKYLIMSRSHRRLAEQPALMRHPGDVGRGGGGRRKRRKLARSKVFSALV